MNVSMPVLIAIGVAFALLLFLVLRRRDRGKDLTAPSAMAAVPRPSFQPQPVPIVYDLPDEVKKEVRSLTAAGRKIEAVKRVREVTGVGLEEALRLVERV